MSHPHRIPGIDLRVRLTENDACGVFPTPDDLVVAGPTRTNVNPIEPTEGLP